MTNNEDTSVCLVNRSVLNLALDALEELKCQTTSHEADDLYYQALTAIKEVLEHEQRPVAYVHVPSVLLEGVVRPVVSFHKYEDDYANGIYSTRIPLYGKSSSNLNSKEIK